MRITGWKSHYPKSNFNRDIPICFELDIIWGNEYQVIGGLENNLKFNNKKDLLDSINQIISQESSGNLKCSMILTIQQKNSKINTIIVMKKNKLFIGNKAIEIMNCSLLEKEFYERINEILSLKL